MVQLAISATDMIEVEEAVDRKKVSQDPELLEQENSRHKKSPTS
ncbi:hypothetical protein O9993_06085 [Vibrio lentus]|nr:hypothetical protein [Vibrio lentus]